MDDYPYGGGAGMVLKPEPIYNALDILNFKEKNLPVIFFTPQRKLLKQTDITRYCEQREIIIIC